MVLERGVSCSLMGLWLGLPRLRPPLPPLLPRHRRGVGLLDDMPFQLIRLMFVFAMERREGRVLSRISAWSIALATPKREVATRPQVMSLTRDW